MESGDRSKKQLIIASDVIDELVELRRRIAEMEAQEARSKQVKEWRPPKIGEILIEMGCLATPELEEALRQQEEMEARGDTHIPIGTILVASGIITEQDLLKAIAEQLARLRYRFR